jgi:hypothetical protein
VLLKLFQGIFFKLLGKIDKKKKKKYSILQLSQEFGEKYI